MIENFLKNQETVLNGKVFITALLFATIFATNIDVNEDRGNETSVIIVNPDDSLLGFYRDFGFYQDVTNFSWISAEVPDIQYNIERKIALMSEQFLDDVQRRYRILTLQDGYNDRVDRLVVDRAVCKIDSSSVKLVISP